MNDQVGLLKEAAGKMKTNVKDILTRIDGLLAETKQFIMKMNLLLRNWAILKLGTLIQK